MSDRPLLTIGMATYDDFDGVYFTIQDLRLHNKEVMKDVEIIVIDNKGSGKASQELSKFIGDYKLGVKHAASHGCFGARYIPYTARTGTSAPRDKVFQEAAGQFVLCVDGHILFDDGAIPKLLEWIKTNPDSKDIISGPIMTDSFSNYHTHYDNFWRGEMWGIWGRAWICPCGRAMYTVQPHHNGIIMHTLDMDFIPHTRCHKCSVPIPDIPYAGHEAELLKTGWTPGDQLTTPFEIPGMGLGLFGMFKDKWPGFHPEARGFGGEELYIHEKVRRNGGRALCLPWLKWPHRFVRVHGVPYPLLRLNKIRNYILEFQELGFDLTPIHDHWVKSGLYTQEQWDHLLDHIHDNTVRELPKNAGPRQPGVIGDLYRHVITHPRDLNQHAPKLRELASMCDYITEFSKRQESTIILCAGLSSEAHKKVVSYHTERGPLQDSLLQISGQLTMHKGLGIPGDIPKEPIAPTDMLFIDSHHTYDQLTKELMTHGPQVRRFIAMHDTHANAERGDDGKPLGLLHAIRSFIIKNPAWRVIYHSEEQYGLTVIGRNPLDLPPEKITILDFISGVGTELKLLLNSIGIHPGPNCGCRGYMKQMNQWGIEGCVERRLVIANHIKDMKKQWGWEDGINRLNPALKTNKWGIIWKTITSGLAFKLNPANPELSLVDLAIAKAKENEL